MPTIASLNVKLITSMGGFAAGMKTAANSVHVLSDSIVKVTDIAGGLGAEFAGGLGVGAIAGMVKEQLDAIATTEHLADRLGMTAAATSELEYAFQIATGSADNFGMTMTRMLTSIDSAASSSVSPVQSAVQGIQAAIEEGGDAMSTVAGADPFAKLGLSAKKLKSEAPQKAFLEIAEGISELPTAADRASEAIAIFGRGGASILPLLNRGSEGIQELMNEADKLGVTISDIDAGKVELAEESLRRLQAAETGAGRTLAIELAPFIDAAANKFEAMATSGDGASAKIKSGFATVTEYLAETADVLSLVAAGWNELRAYEAEAWSVAIDGIGDVLDGFDKLLAMLGQAQTGWGKTAHVFADALGGTAHDALTQATKDWHDFVDGSNSHAAKVAFADIEAASNAAAQKIADNAEKMRAAGGSSAISGAAESLADQAKYAAGVLENLQKQINGLDASPVDAAVADALAHGITDPSLLGKIAGMTAELENTRIAAEKTKAVLGTLEDLQKSLTQIGMTNGQKTIADMQLDHADDTQIAQAEKLLAIRDQITSIEKIDTGNPLTDLASKMNDLQKLYSQALITADQFSHLRDQAQKSLDDKLTQDAQSIIESIKTPLEKYMDKLDELQALLDAGKLTQDQFDRANALAMKDVQSDDPKTAPTLEAGSAAADRFLYEQSRGVDSLNATDIPKKQLDEAKTTNDHLSDIKDALSGDGPTFSTLEIA